MAPIATAVQETQATTIASLKSAVANSATPVDLRAYAHFDNTPAIGTEFRATGDNVLTITDVLADDAKFKALGRLVSERGVVFFRDAVITPEEQKTLVQALGRHGGKPADSGLHVHPCTLPNQTEGDEITIVSNQYVFGDKFKIRDRGVLERQSSKVQWHSDITFENVPSDYASLVIRTLPETGGDTLWASAYEAYDRLSPALQSFFEGLHALNRGDVFLKLAEAAGLPLREGRGSPANVGQELEAVHPVIRTNPVTGWKGLFVNPQFTRRIVELSQVESEALLHLLFETVSANHDLQVRFRWEKDSLAIWDNRSTFHAATPDTDDSLRVGTRSVSLGERPFLDPNSKSRRADLAERNAQV